MNEERAAEILGVSVEEVRRFDLEGNPLAERVLLLWDRKNVGVEGWDGFVFTRGKLKYKSHLWSAKSLLLWRDQADEINRLQAELVRLRSWKGLAGEAVQKIKNRQR
ncbi:hypothetical protein ACQE3D_11740 [Methylomonas sp. MS20]|uniref:hypothetical protein n=1 Tax=unclassified Methylomonas TaxID=2608980 RepID=UPI0028A314C8|nr:hypothetical protein [Methylomonas sp. MV1]MDT4328332.1 hypothetical protein [Methylomonas sp. MV1]